MKYAYSNCPSKPLYIQALGLTHLRLSFCDLCSAEINMIRFLGVLASALVVRIFLNMAGSGQSERYNKPRIHVPLNVFIL